MKRIAICASTVTINGNSYPPPDTIWAGLMMCHAVLALDVLRVPWCHIDDAPTPGADAFYKLRPKDESMRFVKTRSGSFVLERVGL